ncbi:uncharacterized protein LOC124266331 [Haliotis rubra]|uniref:uncharacterized protein LOC124266331 n=1 Tax=Haliotis rubra TaxID=36100 RepID=UPI001EE563C9|nr:uncharacterized protein LOC124266331 [Haliotis rubra]
MGVLLGCPARVSCAEKSGFSRECSEFLQLLIHTTHLNDNEFQTGFKCTVSIKDNAVQDKILSGAVFEVFSKTTLIQCSRLCLYSSRCVSANWITRAKECQLNSRGGDEQSLQVSHSNIYLAVHVNPLQAHPCSHHPCTVEDICVPVMGSTSHICLRTDPSDQQISTVSNVLSITTVGDPEASSEASTTHTSQDTVQTSETSTTANNTLVQATVTSTTANNNLVQASDSSTTANSNLVQTSDTSTTANSYTAQATDTSTTANNNLLTVTLLKQATLNNS